MSLRTTCPHCEREAVFAAEALGKSVRCKGCGKAFAVKSTGKPASSHEHAAVRAGQPPRARNQSADNGDDEHDDHPLRREAADSQMSLWIGLGAIALVTVLASVLVFVLI